MKSLYCDSAKETVLFLFLGIHEKKMRRLRSEFGAKLCADSGKAGGKLKAPWRFHSQMEFLLPNFMPHQTKINLIINSVDSPLEI